MNIVTLEGNNNGHVNMGRDAELLTRAEAGLVGARVYGWDGAWVSLGRSQRPERALIQGCEVPYVTRPTGGKAVLHGHDVTIGLAVPLDSLGLSATQSRSLGQVYRKIVGILVAAFDGCGVRAELGENTLSRRIEAHTADCFAHVAPNDIVDPATGQKICGCALRVTHNAVLVQASVPARRPLVRPESVFLRPSIAFWTAIEAADFGRSLDDALKRTVLEFSVLT